jgi:WD40 repeat protein
VKIWKLESDYGSIIYKTTLDGHSDFILSIAFNSTGNILASGSYDKTVKLWKLNDDYSNGKCIKTLHGHTNYILSIAFNTSGSMLATGGYDNTAKLWELNLDYTDIECIATLRGHTSWICSIAFSPLLPIMATGSYDGTTILWKLSRPKIKFDDLLNFYRIFRKSSIKNIQKLPNDIILKICMHRFKIYDHDDINKCCYNLMLL